MTTRSFPPALVAMHALFRRFGAVRRQQGRAEYHASYGDPLWTLYEAAEASNEAFEFLLSWYQERDRQMQQEVDVPIAEPLQTLLRAVQGVVTGSMAVTPPTLAFQIGREITLPAMQAYDVLDTVVLLVSGVIQAGATTVIVTTSRASDGVTLQSDAMPPDGVYRALPPSVHILHGQAPARWSVEVCP